MSAAERARYLPMVLSGAGQHDSAKKVADLLAELNQAQRRITRLSVNAQNHGDRIRAAERAKEVWEAKADKDEALDAIENADAIMQWLFAEAKWQQAEAERAAVAERDAALAALAEVRAEIESLPDHLRSPVVRRILAVLDRGPR